MAQLFVSHSSADNELAAKVEDSLADLGYQSVFLDFDPTKGLRPGQAWRDQLFENLDGCDAVVFITTPHSNASQWCHSELALTRWLRKPILALLFDGAPPHPLTADLQGLHLTSDDIDRDRVRGALVALGMDQEAAWDASRSPYPGLRAFDESYAAVFFGRDRQIDQLRQLVDPPSRSHEGAIIPVLGPSGSGKSSLVRAGLVPALRVSADWVVSEPWTPSDAPLAEMALSLAHAAKRHDVDLDATRCGELLRTPGGIAEYLRTLREAGTATADTKVLVVVDQAEELVTITSEATRREFLTALTTSCAAPSPLRVVMTARTDMWDRVAAETSQFAMTVAPTVLHVPPLTRSDLATVIREPARRSHLTLEDGLLERLVEDTGSGDALPLLAFTLSRMAADSSDGRLTNAEYDAVGGVQGAIASRAADVARAGRTEKDVAEAVLHLVSLSDAVPHKRPARAADIPAPQRAILDDLADARLVVVSEVDGEQVYAPAHEALLSAWPPLAQLIETRRDDLLLRARLERRAADWRDAGVTSSGLLSGLELDQARDFRQRSGDLTTPAIAAYVDASAARERRTRMVRAGVSAVVAVLVAALVVTLLVNNRSSRRLADASRRLADSAELGELQAIAERDLVADPVAAAVAILRGLGLGGDRTQFDKLATTLVTSPARDSIQTGSATAVMSLGGSLAATETTSGTTLWDLDTGQKAGQLPPGLALLRPDGRAAVVSTSSGLRAYDLGSDPASSTPKQVAAFGPAAALMAFSPDGALLATSSGSAVTLWDLHDPTAPRVLTAWHDPDGVPTAVAPLDDGTVLVADPGHTLVSWEALGDGHEAVLVSAAPQLGVNGLMPAANGSSVLVVSPAIQTGEQLFAVPSGRLLGSYRAGSGQLSVLSVTWAGALDASGRHVAAFDLTGRGYVYKDGKLQTTLVGGHTELINRGQFTADGLLATASADGTVRLWAPDAASTPVSGGATAALCHVFGPRIDAAAWRRVVGAHPFVSPCPSSAPPARSVPALTIGAAAPAPPPLPAAPTVVYDTDFSGPTTPFQLGTHPASTGTITEDLHRGTYRMRTSGVATGYTVWSLVRPHGGMGDTWAVTSTPGASVDGAGCGVVAGDDDVKITAVLDRDTGAGRVNTFALQGQSYSKTFTDGFTAPAGSDGPLTLRGATGRLEVLVGDQVVLSAAEPALTTPVYAGLAVVDNTTCSSDAFSVHRG